MLSHDRIKFPKFQLFSLCARVLFRDVVVARVGAADHFDKNRAWFRHGRNPHKLFINSKARKLLRLGLKSSLFHQYPARSFEMRKTRNESIGIRRRQFLQKGHGFL